MKGEVDNIKISYNCEDQRSIEGYYITINGTRLYSNIAPNCFKISQQEYKNMLLKHGGKEYNVSRGHKQIYFKNKKDAKKIVMVLNLLKRNRPSLNA
jgi:hypothetical protein